MIPKKIIKEWQQNVSWQAAEMVEHDLIISRALVCLYSNPLIKESLIFRGGTALNKLYLNPPSRYSEDIDFVQRNPEPIGKTLDAIQGVLNDWLGKPRRKISRYGVKLVYTYTASFAIPMKLKIEINTVEHFNVLDFHYKEFNVNSNWFNGNCLITTYCLEELMATKLRALYQRRKGRDLFDVWHVFSNGLVDQEKTIELFHRYCERENSRISGKAFHDNMALKKLNKDFQIDMSPLLPRAEKWNFDEAFEYVQNFVIAKMDSI